MKRKNNNSPVTSVNLNQAPGRLYFNYYFMIIVLTVMLANLVLMIYFNPS